MNPENPGGNGTQQRDDGDRKGVLGPTDATQIPEYDPQAAQNPAAEAGAGGSAGSGSGIVAPAGLIKPTGGFRDHIANLLLSCYNTHNEKKIDPATAKRIYEEVAALEAELQISKESHGERYGVDIKFGNVERDSLRGYIKNLSDVFGTDNLDSLTGGNSITNFGFIAERIPEFEPISIINGGRYWNRDVIPMYILLTNAPKEARGLLSLIIEQEARSKQDIIYAVGLSKYPSKDILLINHAFSTKTLVDMEKAGYGSAAEMRKMMNEAVNKYNTTIQQS